jgi:hypothetical protein
MVLGGDGAGCATEKSLGNEMGDPTDDALDATDATDAKEGRGEPGGEPSKARGGDGAGCATEKSLGNEMGDPTDDALDDALDATDEPGGDR